MSQIINFFPYKQISYIHVKIKGQKLMALDRVRSDLWKRDLETPLTKGHFILPSAPFPSTKNLEKNFSFLIGHLKAV